MPTRDTRPQLQHRRDYPYASCGHLMDCQGVKDGGGGCCDDDDSSSSCGSWTEDAASYSGTSGGSSGSSSLSGDAGKGEKARGKWLKSLWSAIDHLADERKVRHPQHPVKTILRPPTEYVYVIGMSGLPSKVAVYPKQR